MEQPSSRLHPVFWVLWMVAALAVVVVFANPVYSCLMILLALSLVYLMASSQQRKNVFVTTLVAAGIFALVRIVFMLLTTHGVSNSFLTIPTVTMPNILGGFSLGGTLEWQVLWQSVSEALLLIAVVAIVGVGGAVVTTAEWVLVMPRAFLTPVLTISIAIASFPLMIRSAQLAREADRARIGTAPVSKRRSLRRIFVPVLDDALDRAVAVSETLEARSFGSQSSSGSRFLAFFLTISGLLAISLLVAGDAVPRQLFQGLIVMTTLAGGYAIYKAKQQVAPKFRPLRFTQRDVFAMVVVVGVVTSVVMLGVFVQSFDISWNASSHSFPALSFVPTVVLLALGIPILFASPQRSSHVS